MTSNEYQGKYDRLCNRAIKDIVTIIKEKGPKELEKPLGFRGGIYTKIGDMGDYEILGVSTDGTHYFFRTDFGNMLIDNTETLDNLIQILKFLE